MKEYSGIKIFGITYFPANVFPYILASNVPNNIEINPLFCTFTSCLIVSLIHFITNPDSSSDLTIFIIFSFSLMGSQMSLMA